jgi:hypothetical protein
MSCDRGWRVLSVVVCRALTALLSLLVPCLVSSALTLGNGPRHFAPSAQRYGFLEIVRRVADSRKVTMVGI